MSTSIDRSSCTESQLPLSEIMQRTLRDFQGFKRILEEDHSERAVQNVMDSLSKYKIAEHLPGNISIFFMEIVNNLWTPTHNELLNEFTCLIGKLENAIQAQREKEIVQAQQSNEDTQPQPNEEGAEEGAQPPQDAESTQSQQSKEDIQAKQHEANVRFVEAMFKVLLMNADQITRLLEDSMK